MAITLIGATLRFANLGHLGLDHFDEGIYGAAGAWIHLPGGLADLEPGLVAYAPPLFPILLGVAYSVMGMNDFAAVMVSIVAGIATIPLVGWLGRRWMGPGAGAACAAFAALSGTHLAFSRMALTDSTFLLFWILGMVAGAEFLAKPGPFQAVGLGLAVGLAQLTKYNGWLIGAVIAIATLSGFVFQSEDRSRSRVVRTLAWGLLAAGIAMAIYWPWFRFVDSQIGYSALLKHQRSYLGEVSAWPDHLMTQIRQVVALSGGELWGIAATALAIGGLTWSLDLSWQSLRLGRGWLAVLALVFLLFFPVTSGWWLGIALVGGFLKSAAPRLRMLGAWWFVLTILTPMYHPYARLWLPLEAAGWVFKAFVLCQVVTFATQETSLKVMGLRSRVLTASVLTSLILARIMIVALPPRPVPLPDFLGPRDSFRIATARIVSQVPPEVDFVRLLGRPTLRYYILPPLSSRGIRTVRESSLDELLQPGEGWAIVDTALLRQEGNYVAARERLADRCRVIAQEPILLSPATLLDIDASAAFGNLEGRREWLLLVRHKREGDPN